MSTNPWIEQFRALHQRASRGELKEEERQHYLATREQFARAMTAAQGLTLSGQSARRTFRVAQGLQLDLQLPTGPLRAMTVDVSVGGFSVLMHQPPNESEQFPFTLRLPGKLAPVTGQARVVSVQRKIGTHRVSFAIHGLGEKDLGRMEMAMFDLALERLK